MNLLEMREAVCDDAADIQALMREVFAQYAKDAGIKSGPAALYETLEDIREDIKNKIVLVAYVNGVIAGSVRLDKIGETTVYLSRLGIGEKFRKLGLGRTIMTMVDTILTERGVKSIELHTASKAAEQIAFYYRNGYYIHSTDTEKGYIRAKLVKDYNC